MEAGALIAEAGLWAQWLLLSLGPLLVYASVITVVHELGHALAARPAGYHLTSVGVGRGPRLLRLRLPNGVIVVLHAVLFAGGSCVAIPRDGEAGRRGAWFHAGGVLAQLALAGVLAAWPQRWWSQDLTDFNFVVLVWNLLPWQFHGQTSDGWWLLSRLWPAAIAARWPGEGAAGTVGSKGPAFARLAAVEQARGSPIGARYAALMQSWSALQRRELGLAEALAAGPRLAAGEGPPALRALEDYVGVEAARQGGAAAVGAGEGASAWARAARGAGRRARGGARRPVGGGRRGRQPWPALLGHT